MREERMFFAMAIAFATAVLVLGLFGAGALAAGMDLGGPIISTLADSLNLPGLESYWSQSSAPDGNAYIWASVALKNHKLSHVNWDFNIDKQDTSRWDANLWMHGFLLGEGEHLQEAPDASLSSDATVAGVTVNKHISLYYFHPWIWDPVAGTGYSDESTTYIQLTGNLLVSPARIDYGSF